MSLYLQIAREHLTTEELEMLLAERKKPAPKKMTMDQVLENRIGEKVNRIMS